MRVPAALAALPLLAGSAAGVLLVDSTPAHLVLAAAASACLALIAGCGFLADGFDGAVALAVGVGSAACGFSLGTSCARDLYAPSLLAWYDAHAAEDADPVTVTGVLREDAARTEYGASIAVNVARAGLTDVDGGVRLSIGGAVTGADLDRWRAGRAVRLPVLLRYPATFGNPGVPDDRQALARRGIALTGSVKSPALVEVLAPASWLAEAAGALRARMRAVLARHVGPLSGRSAAVAIAILIGDRTGLSDEDERRLQDAGTYHVIAISGGNIAILTAMLLVAGRLLGLPHRAAAVGAMAILLFYGQIAGGAASVQRALAAAVLLLAARVLDHRGAPLNTVAVAAILGLAAWPMAILDAGFLLSFGATAGIIIGIPRLIGGVHRGKAAAALLAATVCAEVALAPITAACFSRVTVAGLVVNFAAIPSMTLVQASSMALLVVSPFSAVWADRIATVVHASANALIESSRFIELAPWMARDVPVPAWWLCAAYYLACAGLLVPRTRRAAGAAWGLAAVCLVTGAESTSRHLVPLPPPGVLRLVVLDVGQGDATVALLPNGSSLVIDAGGLAGTTFDIARRVVIPAMRALQVARVHALTVTHPDPDHIGGAEGVLRHFRPANVWEGVPVPPHPVRRALASQAHRQGSVWRTVRPGDVERAGEVEVRVLHPPEPDWERQRVRNDDSVVLELRYRDVSIVLPGDISREVERALVPTLRLAPTVILKAAHHGSATSSGEAFLEATQPRAVIFSAGRNNRFDHPAKVVVDRFARRGVEMFNTALDGAVFVETDGRDVHVSGWTSRRLFRHQGH